MASSTTSFAVAILSLITVLPVSAQPTTTPTTQPLRWSHSANGITWTPTPSDPPHTDNIETSGQRCSLILTYGTTKDGALTTTPHVVWPTLRTLPNNTHGSLQFTFSPDHRPTLRVNNEPITERLTAAHLNGLIHLHSTAPRLFLSRTFFASTERPLAVERLTLTNISAAPITVELAPPEKTRTTDPAKGLDGAYEIKAVPLNNQPTTISSGQSRTLTIYYTAHPTTQPLSLPDDAENEQRLRQTLVDNLSDTLVLTTPNPDINRLFAFAKIRAAESLFRTKNGLVHSPGGRAYYAAVWANDQAEYANPLFGYLGYAPAREAAETSFDWFAKYMNPEFKRIPSSIIAEGTSFWNGAKDRGDMAMIAYGASRYTLATGSKPTAEKLYPLITWCLEYLNRQLTPEGIIASDSDELEGRFPAGKANLNTAGLTYDALLSASYLARDLGHTDQAKLFTDRAATLKTSIEKHFGSTVEGYSTYRYYDGNTTLRAWIATPLTVDIFNRTEGTLDALFSPRLWTIDGLATEAGKPTFWDRATLYGFRGAFAAGPQGVDRAFPYFTAYTSRRLRGEHVPYPVEAYPEGNQRHLSAESALYIRAITEGLLHLRPTGLNSFTLTPHFPKQWAGQSYTLSNLPIAGTTINITVTESTTTLTLPNRPPITSPTNQPITISNP